MYIPRHINSSLAFSTMFSQEFHHINFEGQCSSFIFFTSRNLRTTKSEQSWLDENIEAFPAHVEYATGPLACKNSLLVGFANFKLIRTESQGTVCVFVALILTSRKSLINFIKNVTKCGNAGRHATGINLQYLPFRVMYANTSKDPLPWNNYHANMELFFKDAIFWRVPEGGSPFWCGETL